MELAAERFIEKMGMLFEADGASRTAGRLMGLPMLSAEPHSLEELAERLRVSKASVSTNARALERYGTIERVTRPGDRRDYYQIADAMPAHLTARRIEHLTRMRDLISGTCPTEPAGGPVQERLESFASFFEAMIRAMDGARDQWLARERGTGTDGAASGGGLRALR